MNTLHQRRGPLHGAVAALVERMTPRSLPRRARPAYRRELASWAFIPLMLGALEGGTMSVVVQKAFAGAEGLSQAELNLALAAVIAAPEFANLTAFLWAGLASGHRKVPFIAGLQLVACGLVAALALIPATAAGLVALCILYLVARSLWTGVITLRAVVWRGNYGKQDRAIVAGRMATVQSLVLACTGLLVGAAMDHDPRAFHVLFPLLGAAGLAGNAIYRRVRLRGEPRLLAGEREERADRARSRASPMAIIEVLRRDRDYRSFMVWMFVFGLGNLLIALPLTKAFAESSYSDGILVRTTIPLAVMPLAIPFWARLLAKRHVVEFRAIHCWTFVAAAALLVVASALGERWLFFLASVVMGVGFAGGSLAWNIGHSDFAPPDQDALYMSVHVTLNGVRGLLSPFIAVALWEWLAPRGLAPMVFVVCLAVNTVGAIGFVRLATRVRARHARKAVAVAVAAAQEPAAMPSMAAAPADAAVSRP